MIIGIWLVQVAALPPLQALVAFRSGMTVPEAVQVFASLPLPAFAVQEQLGLQQSQ
jgi:hypothetical protein